MKRIDLILFCFALIWAGSLFSIFINTEVPVGSVKGLVLAGESGRPIPEAEVSLYPIWAEVYKPFRIKTDPNGQFELRGIPTGKYSVYCSSSAHALIEEPGEETILEIREGETSEVTMRLRRIITHLSVWVDKPIFTTDQTVRIWASGYAPSPKIKISLYRLELEKLSLSQLFMLGDYVYPWRQPGTPPKISLPVTLVNSWDEFVERDAEFNFNWGRNLPPLGAGFYKVEVQSGEISWSTFFLITDLSLLIKMDGRKNLIWATDLRNGAPLEDVELIVESKGRITLFKTNKDGLWESEALPSGKIVGRFGPSYAFLTIREYEIPIYEEAGYRIYTYTERPVYRPGQTVFFKCIVRKLEGKEYKLPPSLPLKVEVSDEEGNPVYITVLQTNSFGSCSGSFKIPPTAKPGSYQIFVSAKEVSAYDTRYFTVSVYRKPEFEVWVKPDKERYQIGETAKVEVKADYLFGFPVAGANVDYLVYRSPYEYLEGGEYGELVKSGTTQTDRQGRAVISIPLERELGRMRDYIYSVEVTVTDASDRSSEASATFSVMKSPFGLTIEVPRRIYQIGEKVEARIFYSTPDKKGRNVTLSLSKLTWEGRWAKRKERERWRFHMEDGDQRVISFVLGEEGEYELSARVGKYSVETISLTVLPSFEEGCYALPQPMESPRLFAEEKIHEETKEGFFILDLPFEANVLLTYEGEKLYKYEVRNLQRGRHLFKIPKFGEEYYMLFIEASFILKGKLVSESTVLHLPRPHKKLEMQIQTDKNVYQPREEVFCRVKIEDEEGKPLKGELSVAVVDEGVFKVIEENADIDIRSAFDIQEFHRVITRWSGEQIYLGPVSKAFAPSEVRQYFPDTAFWLPSLPTDDKGNASFRFKLPDNITSWRITVVGNIIQGIFGANKTNITTQKPLFVRLALPSFLRQGDTTTITGIVHNQTQVIQKVKVELSVDGLTILDHKEKQLRVEAGGVGEVKWLAKVGESRSADFILYALSESGLKDAIKLTIPILPFGLEKEYSKSGQTEGTVVEKVNIEEDAIPSSIQLSLNLSPSLTSSIMGALEYLIQYPYGCTEQTVSTFLPDIAVQRFLKERGIRNEKLEKVLPDMISKGIFRLYALRHSDGGWGWSESDLTIPWTTAYALWGLWEARKTGFPINEGVLEEGKKSLLGLMKKELTKEVVPKLGGWEKEQWLFVLYVLSLMGENISSYIDHFLPVLSELKPKGKALLTLSYLNLGKRKEADYVFKKLWKERKENGDICYWGNAYLDVEETAYVLRALLKLQPHDPTAIKVVKYILAMRKGKAWHSTKDTAQVIISLLEFSKIWEDIKPDFHLLVQVNGREVKRLHFTPSEVFTKPIEVIIDGKVLRIGSNELRLIKVGKGKLFYSLALKQALRKEMIEGDKGLLGVEISRLYRPVYLSEREGMKWKAGNPREEFIKGKLIEVEVSLSFKGERALSNYLIIEEPLPAGCEFMGLSDEGSWDYEELGDKVSFYLPTVETTELKLRYRLRGETPGNYKVMPTLIYNMYFPQYKSIGHSNKVIVK